MTTAADTIRVFCVDKNSPTDRYATDLELDWTIGEITAALMSDGFLDNDDWLVHHARTGTQLTPGMTLDAAGIEDGDQLSYGRRTHGA